MRVCQKGNINHPDPRLVPSLILSWHHFCQNYWFTINLSHIEVHYWMPAKLTHRYERKLQSKRYLSFFDQATNRDNQTICRLLVKRGETFMRRAVWCQYYDLTGKGGEQRENPSCEREWWMMDNGGFAAFIRSPHTAVSNFFPAQVDLKILL